MRDSMNNRIIGDMAVKDLSPKDTNVGHRIIKNMRICGSGIYKYASSEAEVLGLTPVPEKYKNLDVINVYRPPEVLKRNKDLFARIPIITGHHVLVDETNAKQLTVGMVGDTVLDGIESDCETYLYTTGTIVAGDGIQAYEDYGQLSVGYIPTMKWEEGVHRGEAYQAVLTGFECINHLLICKVARGGPQCMVMDSMSPLERFIINNSNNGGTEMGIFTKIFGSKKVAGDSSVVSALLQSIAVGADPATQVAKVKAIVGDSDPVFNGYLDELSAAKEEKPEILAKAVNIVDAYYRDHLAGDEKPEPKPKTEDEEPKSKVEDEKPESKSKVEEVVEHEACPYCGKDPCECKKEVGGDAIDYDKIINGVVEKLKPQVQVPETKVTDEAPAIAGDSQTQSISSDEIMKSIWG